MKKPMLLSNDDFDLKQIDYTNMFESIKRDGVRAEVSNTGILGRSFKAIRNVNIQSWFKETYKGLPDGMILEAEIYAHGLPCREIAGICNYLQEWEALTALVPSKAEKEKALTNSGHTRFDSKFKDALEFQDTLDRALNMEERRKKAVQKASEWIAEFNDFKWNYCNKKGNFVGRIQHSDEEFKRYKALAAFTSIAPIILSEYLRVPRQEVDNIFFGSTPSRTNIL